MILHGVSIVHYVLAIGNHLIGIVDLILEIVVNAHIRSVRFVGHVIDVLLTAIGIEECSFWLKLINFLRVSTQIEFCLFYKGDFLCDSESLAWYEKTQKTRFRMFEGFVY